MGLEAAGESLGGILVWSVLAVEGTLESLFDELAAMNFHGRKRTEISGEVVGFQVSGFLGGFAFEEFGGHGGHGDGGLTSECLEGGAVDDFLAILFGELEPHTEHVSAIWRAYGTDAIGVLHFAHILRGGHGITGFVFEVVAHVGKARPSFRDVERG